MYVKFVSLAEVEFSYEFQEGWNGGLVDTRYWLSMAFGNEVA